MNESKGACHCRYIKSTVHLRLVTVIKHVLVDLASGVCPYDRLRQRYIADLGLGVFCTLRNAKNLTRVQKLLPVPSIGSSQLSLSTMTDRLSTWSVGF